MLSELFVRLVIAIFHQKSAYQTTTFLMLFEWHFDSTFVEHIALNAHEL